MIHAGGVSIGPGNRNSVATDRKNLFGFDVGAEGFFPKGPFAGHFIHTGGARALETKSEIRNPVFLSVVETESGMGGIVWLDFGEIRHGGSLHDFLSNCHELPLKFDEMDAISQKKLHELLDPINRLYRHRVAKRLAGWIRPTGISPNQISFAHGVVGVLAAVSVYDKRYLLAVLLLELRAILDCMDGILARMKNQSTAFGRTLDAIADGITFNAIMIAGALRMIHDFPTYRPSLILIAVFLFAMTAAHCGSVYQLMKRKLGSIILQQIDSVEREWREHAQKVRENGGGWIPRFGFWLDSLTIRFVSEEWFEKIDRRRHAADWEERALRDATTMNELARITRRREFNNAVRFTAYVSDDNILAVIGLCLVVLGIFPLQILPYVHPVLIAFGCGFFYSILSLLLGLHFLHDFYHGVYRD